LRFPLTAGTNSMQDCSNSLTNYIACIAVEEDFCPVKGAYNIFLN